MNICVHLTCEICDDTWFRDMTERQLADYMTDKRRGELPQGHRSQRWNLRRCGWRDL